MKNRKLTHSGKHKPHKLTYRPAAFRMKRHQSVRSFIHSSLVKIKTLKDPKQLLYKEKLIKRLSEVSYFDSPSKRKDLESICKFVQITLLLDIRPLLDHLISEYENVVLNKGSIFALKLFKELSSIVYRIISGNAFAPIKYIKSFPDGTPYILGPLKKLLHGTLNERRSCAAALQVFKLVEVWDMDALNLGNIVVESPIKQLPFNERPRVGNYFERFFEQKPNDIPSWFNSYKWTEAWKDTLNLMFNSNTYKNRLEDISKMSTIHVSGRNGPNGPCLTTVVLDHDSLTNRCKDPELYENIRSIATLTNNKKLVETMSNFDEEPYIWSSPKKKRPIHSKISFKKEAWGRLRAFAICDWFSHSALRGFHDYLLRWLAEQPEDGTFKQDHCSEIVRQWTTTSENSETADLTTATDSIPVEVQAEIVSAIAGRTFAMQWRQVVSNRTFSGPKGDTKYACGQPMGISSSWPMLAMWHHCIMRTILTYLGIERDPKQCTYFIIGDDNSMATPEMFRIYEYIVEVVQGVGISKLKGFHTESRLSTNPLPTESHPTPDTNHTAELAKRIFCNGQELSIVPPDEVLTCLREPAQFKELLFSLEKRSYPTIDVYKNLPALTSLSRDKKLALTLVTSPYGPQPFCKGMIDSCSDLAPYNSIFWYLPDFDLAKTNKAFAREVRVTIIRSLQSIVSNMNQWIVLALKGGEIKVKDWVYECETQGLVIYMVVDEAKYRLEKSLVSFMPDDKLPKLTADNWGEFQKILKSFKTLSDIDQTLLGKTRSDREKKLFEANFISSVIKKIKDPARQVEQIKPKNAL